MRPNVLRLASANSVSPKLRQFRSINHIVCGSRGEWRRLQHTSSQEDQVHISRAKGPASTVAASLNHPQLSSPLAGISSKSYSSLPDDNPNFDIENFSELPHKDFGINQILSTNADFRRALLQILWQFRAPIRYSFAYGSGVFPQSGGKVASSSLSPHPHPPEAIAKWQKGGGKVIDFIFGVTFTQHWQSLNLHEHPDHYSFLRWFGSGLISRIQDDWGAGVYFNPYITVNGTMIKYGVVNLDTLYRDLSQWNTLYLAGRLQKPVKILRETPQLRVANQVNLISALRCALLLLGSSFTEKELYTAIAGLSYMGDPRMSWNAENPKKVSNIVSNQLPYFRQLYSPFIEELPNVTFVDSRVKHGDSTWRSDVSGEFKLSQDMDPVKRGNMVRRLPSAFRSKLYFSYQRKFQIPELEFQRMIDESVDEDATSFRRRQGGPFEQRIATEDDLREKVAECVRQTVKWPSTSQSIKGPLTAGPLRTWRYLKEKKQKNREGQKKGRMV